MIVKEFKIVSGGKCPICRAPVNMDIHGVCVVELDDMLRRGVAELLNWTDPLPGQFVKLRRALFVQLERNEVLINSLGDCADYPRRSSYIGREDETIY